jgi:hypothetical protein
MAISYPLSLPITSSPASIVITAAAINSISISPYTYQQQTQVYPGQWFEASISLPSMKRDSAEYWIAFLLSLNGKQGTFLLGDPSGSIPRGVATGTPVLSGAHSSATGTLTTTGWTISTTGIMKAGDYIQLGTTSASRMHKLLADANSDGSGNATLYIWPNTRIAYASSTAIAVTSCKSVFRLSNNKSQWSITEAQIYGIDFTAIEAI